MSDVNKYYIHAGYILDWTSREVQRDISELLAPHLSWLDAKKKGDRIQKHITLKKQPIVCMSYYANANPKQWFEAHDKKGEMGYFKAMWYRRDLGAAVLQGTINGKPIYVVISVNSNIPPMTIKRQIALGSYTKVDIDVRFPLAAYVYVETKEVYNIHYYRTLRTEYICGIPYEE